MNVTCSHCGADVPERNLKATTALARCPKCREVFSFVSELATDGPPSSREDVAMPRSITVEYTGTSLLLVHRWISIKTALWAFATIAWAVCLTQMYGDPGARDALSMFKWMFEIQVALGVCMAYVTMAGLCNSTRIETSETELIISHGPLPWLGGRHLELAEINQLFTRERVSYERRGKRYIYGLYALLKSGKRLKLLSRLRLSEQALFLEQQIERFAGIVDRPVGGELRR